MPTRVMVRFIIEQSLLLACLVNNCLLLLKTRRHYFLVVARLLRVLWATSHWAIGAALDNKKYNFNMVSLEGAFAEWGSHCNFRSDKSRSIRHFPLSGMISEPWMFFIVLPVFDWTSQVTPTCCVNQLSIARSRALSFQTPELELGLGGEWRRWTWRWNPCRRDTSTSDTRGGVLKAGAYWNFKAAMLPHGQVSSATLISHPIRG